MGLVAAICTQCGASIQVDESKEAGICAHCGTAFITEKVINNYHIHNTTNVTNNIENANITMKTGDDEKDLFARYKAFMLLEKYAQAREVAQIMMQKFPHKAITHFCNAHLALTNTCEIGKPAPGEKCGNICDEEFDYEKINKAMREFIAAPEEDFIQRAKEIYLMPVVFGGTRKLPANVIYKKNDYDCGYSQYLSLKKNHHWISMCESSMHNKIFELDEYTLEPAKNFKECNKYVYDNYDDPERLSLPQKKADKHIVNAYAIASAQEKAEYADFIAEVEEKNNAYSELMRMAAQVVQRVKYLKQKLVEAFREGRKVYRRKKFIKRFSLIGGAVVAVAVAVLVLVLVL